MLGINCYLIKHKEEKHNLELVNIRVNHYNSSFIQNANVAKLVDALDLGSSRLFCESSSLSIRTTLFYKALRLIVLLSALSSHQRHS